MDETRREQFPIATYRWVEALCDRIRRRVMNLAAEAAAERDKRPDMYTVEREDIERVFSRVLCETLLERI